MACCVSVASIHTIMLTYHVDLTHRQTACDTISLLILEPKYKASANKMGVIPDFVRLLRLPVTGEVTCAVGMTLISLVDGSTENRKEFRKCLGIRPVVKLLAAGPDADVTVASCRLIALLSTERENKVESQVVSLAVPPERNGNAPSFCNTMRPHVVA